MGYGHVDAATLCDYLDAVELHFNNNPLNPVVVYVPQAITYCDLLLEDTDARNDWVAKYIAAFVNIGWPVCQGMIPLGTRDIAYAPPADAWYDRSAAWDGIDSAGSPAASGVYLVRLESSGQAQTKKILLLK
jgi:hypothetical protein